MWLSFLMSSPSLSYRRFLKFCLSFSANWCCQVLIDFNLCCRFSSYCRFLVIVVFEFTVFFLNMILCFVHVSQNPGSFHAVFAVIFIFFFIINFNVQLWCFDDRLIVVKFINLPHFKVPSRALQLWLIVVCRLLCCVCSRFQVLVDLSSMVVLRNYCRFIAIVVFCL